MRTRTAQLRTHALAHDVVRDVLIRPPCAYGSADPRARLLMSCAVALAPSSSCGKCLAEDSQVECRLAGDGQDDRGERTRRNGHRTPVRCTPEISAAGSEPRPLSGTKYRPAHR